MTSSHQRLPCKLQGCLLLREAPGEENIHRKVGVTVQCEMLRHQYDSNKRLVGSSNSIRNPLPQYLSDAGVEGAASSETKVRQSQTLSLAVGQVYGGVRVGRV